MQVIIGTGPFNIKTLSKDITATMPRNSKWNGGT
jgi:hypothetical protein